MPLTLLLLASAPAYARSPRAALRPYHLLGNGTLHHGSPRPQDTRAHRVPLLVLIFSTEANGARRQEQHRTWLNHDWRDAAGEPVPWRYAYVIGRRGGAAAATVPPDELVGDRLHLGRVEDTYLGLVHKTLEALRWAAASVSFEALLKTDDDSIAHVSRLWAWLGAAAAREASEASAWRWGRLYAGRLQVDSQVVRSNFTAADLWHPSWYPRDFLKWAVPVASFGADRFPPHCSGGGYLLGRDAAASLLAERARWVADPFPVEDAFLGVLAQRAGLAPTNLGPNLRGRQSEGCVAGVVCEETARHALFEDPPASSPQGRALFAGRILVHRVSSFERAFAWLLLEPRRRSQGRARGGGSQQRGGEAGHVAAMRG